MSSAAKTGGEHDEETESVALFSQSDLFPVPSEKVLTVDIRDGSVRILKCTLPALLVKLSSPLDNVDYSMLTDFFLVYRSFISSESLLELILERFQWALTLRQSESRQKSLSEIILVRMFVLIRHWLSNYFAQDFVLNASLRSTMLLFINSFSPSDKFLDNIILSLKKLWVQNVQLMWEDVGDLASQNNISTREQWLNWKISDVSSVIPNNHNGDTSNQSSQTTLSKQRRLSSIALQNINDPAHRNESLLSLLHTKEKIPLPQQSEGDTKKQSMRIKQRTGSMLLFPENASNGYTAKQNHSYNNTHLQESSTNQKNVTITTLKSLHTQNITQLSKDTDLNHQTKVNPQRVQNPPRVEKLIKYVFSISSLETHSNPQPDSIGSKFDILSARTIEEVEYLISVEKDLLEKVEENRISAKTSKIESSEDDSNDYSVIDNLNLYKTVSSIANSVISLSKTLNNKGNKSATHLLSPSMTALERRKIRNSAPMLHSYNSSRYSISNALIGVPKSDERSSPKRLVFLDSKRNSPTKKAILANSLGNIGEYNGQRNSITSVVTYDSAFSSTSASEVAPNKNNANSNIFMDAAPTLKRKVNVNDLRRFNFEEPDSTEINNNKSNENVDQRDSVSIHTAHNEIDATKPDSELENADISSLITAYEESTSELDNARNSVAEVKRPTSGRISISRNQNAAISASMSSAVPKSPLILRNEFFIERDQALAYNQDIISELEETTSHFLKDDINLRSSSKHESLCNDSDSQSVATNLLFTSAKASPQKAGMRNSVSFPEEEEYEYNSQPASHSSVPKLSQTPSIKSITSHDSEHSLEHSSDSSAHKSSKYTSIREQLQLAKQPTSDIFDEDIDNINTEQNKYLFSPDIDNGDYASPEKNLDDLKQQFIDAPDEETSLEEEEDDIDNPATNPNVVENEEIDEKKLEDIMNGIDDTMDSNMDPVSLALMKLEGTYVKDKNGEDDKSSPVSESLAMEVEKFQMIQSTALPESARERQSMFIQRRRNTMIDLGVRNSTDESESAEDNSENTDEQIRRLLSEYQITDPRLGIKNLNQHIPFILMYDSKSVATQLTLIEKDILSEIDWKDLLELNMKDQLPQFTSWLQLLVYNDHLSGIDLAIGRFNLTVDWIISEIVMTQDIRLRRNTIQRFIHIAEHCKELQNYNTMMQIILALSSIVVQRFTETWRLVEPGDLLTWENLKVIPSIEKNYGQIRQLLDNMNPLSGCIPFIVVYLSDLSLNTEKHTWIVPNELLNYNKFQIKVQIVKNFVQRMQWSKFYRIYIDNELLSKCVYLTSLSHDEINTISAQHLAPR
ncbi:Guanine nucleotide exchange factor lte1 [Kluyveromyces marxianus]|nr:Guanine nucleotide exchange factor lte1 [Kluyveromyces marxianus]